MIGRPTKTDLIVLVEVDQDGNCVATFGQVAAPTVSTECDAIDITMGGSMGTEPDKYRRFTPGPATTIISGVIPTEPHRIEAPDVITALELVTARLTADEREWPDR